MLDEGSVERVIAQKTVEDCVDQLLGENCHFELGHWQEDLEVGNVCVLDSVEVCVDDVVESDETFDQHRFISADQFEGFDDVITCNYELFYMIRKSLALSKIEWSQKSANVNRYVLVERLL